MAAIEYRGVAFKYKLKKGGGRWSSKLAIESREVAFKY